MLAGIIYVLSIAAFVKAHSGLTTVGIYRLSRNPMYVAMSMILVAFVFMAWSAAPIMGILMAVVALCNAAITHWMVLGEERFLESKYGGAYAAYKKGAPRYFLVVKKHRGVEVCRSGHQERGLHSPGMAKGCSEMRSKIFGAKVRES
jgi:protein-S-isoprenylcysteine O-methyltransferase Ste14